MEQEKKVLGFLLQPGNVLKLDNMDWCPKQ